MSFIERFHCTQTAVHYTNCHPWLNYIRMYLCHCVCSNSPLLWSKLHTCMYVRMYYKAVVQVRLAVLPHPHPAPPTPRHIPISLDVGTGPNIILCGQYKLVVQDPLRFVVQAGRWMQLHNLHSCHGNDNKSTALQQGPHTYVCMYTTQPSISALVKVFHISMHVCTEQSK